MKLTLGMDVSFIGMPLQNSGSMFTADGTGSGSAGDSLYGKVL